MAIQEFDKIVGELRDNDIAVDADDIIIGRSGNTARLDFTYEGVDWIFHAYKNGDDWGTDLRQISARTEVRGEDVSLLVTFDDTNKSKAELIAKTFVTADYRGVSSFYELNDRIEAIPGVQDSSIFFDSTYYS